MGLKSRINGTYAEWNKKALSFKSEIGLCESNLDQVQINIKKLKDELCRFASRFDKLRSISKATLNCSPKNSMYVDIASNFVKKIEGVTDNFIYIYAKGESENEFEKKWKQAIEKFNFPYQNILDKFTEYEKLINFFNDASIFFGKSMQEGNFCWWKDVQGVNRTDDIIKINSALNAFVGNIFSIMADELEHKAELIVANDEKYFNDLDVLVGRGLRSPVFAEVIKKAEKSFKNNPSFQGEPDEEDLKDYIVQNFAKLFPKGIKLPEDMLSFLEKHTIQPVIGDVKIFPTKESPLPNEVRQAGIRDCYLMASLIALAKSKKNAQAIRNCFVQGADKIEQLDDIQIRFFHNKAKQKGSVGEVIITVNKKKVIMPKSIKDGALWPKLIEKAYAIYRKKGYEKDAIKGRKYLDSGKSKNVFFAITGVQPGEYTAGTDAKEKFNSENIMGTIGRKLEKQKAISCRFKENFTITDVKNGEKVEIHTRHAYAIVGVNQSQKYIRLIEPNKFWGRKDARVIAEDEATGVDIIKLPKEGGHVAMSFGDFNKHLDRLYYTRNLKA